MSINQASKCFSVVAAGLVIAALFSAVTPGQAKERQVATSIHCTGRVIWVQVWEQENSLRTSKFVMATANYLGESGSRYGNLFGPQVLTKDGVNFGSIGEVLASKKAQGNEPWGKVFELDLEAARATYTVNGRVVVDDRNLVCKEN